MDTNWRIKSLQTNKDDDQFTVNVHDINKNQTTNLINAIPPNKNDVTSYGIACCRIKNNKPEILLVCKRNTYAYRSFVFGDYVFKSDAVLIKLFSKMTLDEKIDILSFNFSQMWYRTWLNQQLTSNYYTCRAKFMHAFAKDDGKRLKNLISKSVNAHPIWEIPKGRKDSYRECDINCAIREFYEETGIDNSKYKVYPNKQNIMSYNDEGKRYTNIYYTAIIEKNINVGVNNALKEQLREIVDCRWMNIDAIRFVDQNRRIENFVKHIFNFVKQQ